jgi:hypothetical protein
MKRYEPDLEYSIDHDAEIPSVRETSDGEYVLHSDHQAVVAKLRSALDACSPCWLPPEVREMRRLALAADEEST